MKGFSKVAAAALAAMMLAGSAYAGAGAGTLYRDPNMGGYDFYDIPALTKPYANLAQGVSMKMQTKFTWYGTYGQHISTDQHALMAFTQTATQSNLLNRYNQVLFTHGAGAFVGERGLVMELWWRTDSNNNGYQDDPTNAATWNQDNNRCVQDVLQTIGPNVYCIGSTPGASEYITPAPNFQLKKGIAYYLEISLKPSVLFTGRTRLEATLHEQGPFGKVLVQSAATDFVTASFLPFSNQDIKYTVGRTPGSAGEPYVYWETND